VAGVLGVEAGWETHHSTRFSRAVGRYRRGRPGTSQSIRAAWGSGAFRARVAGNAPGRLSGRLSGALSDPAPAAGALSARADDGHDHPSADPDERRERPEAKERPTPYFSVSNCFTTPPGCATPSPRAKRLLLRGGPIVWGVPGGPRPGGRSGTSVLDISVQQHLDGRLAGLDP
jgi:hypothetical protein